MLQKEKVVTYFKVLMTLTALSNGCQGIPLPKTKRPWRNTDHSPLCGAKVKNSCNYIPQSTPSGLRPSSWDVPKAAVTWYKLTRVSQVPGMRAQTFLSSRITKAATSFKVKPVEIFITCTKRLRAHPRHMTRASKFASCKCRFKHTVKCFTLLLRHHLRVNTKEKSWQLQDWLLPIRDWIGGIPEHETPLHSEPYCGSWGKGS
jgi:hypothetical protein